MRSMSATRLVNSYELDETGAAPAADGAVPTGSASTSNTGSTVANIRLPNFDYGEAAVASRIAGRRNAARISESDHDALLIERQVLLNKHFAGEITKKEHNRLEYVRWQLDRIEDALYGDAADFLEGAIERYERLSKDMKDLTSQLSEMGKAKR
ncbi:hypothetical protein AAFG07_07915 [Bradyrhizobium sp. B097]|uniref:hypothetical protein n=1 Tax=Bradyrhizobium sp. B097 TaxID=3140244 RepID=UPI00318300FC